MVFAREESVIDEVVFLDREFRVTPLQIAGAIVFYSMAQNQILRARRRPDRVGLHEAELSDGTRECGWREQRSRHGVAAQVVQGNAGLGLHIVRWLMRGEDYKR